MNRRVGFLILCCLALCLGSAEAQTVPQQMGGLKPGQGFAPALTDAYCNYTEGAAQSEAVRLLAPDIFATGGVFNSALETGSLPVSATFQNRTRVMAGGNFSLANVEHGLALERRARADCESYRVTSQIESFLRNNSNSVTTQALEARAAVLRSALPRGEAILETTGKSVETFSLTVQEVDAVRLRLDELRRMLEEAEGQKALAADSQAFAEASLPALLKRAQGLQVEMEMRSAKVRQAGIWDLSVRGGYDHLFVPNEGRPFFLMGTLTVNLGGLWQRKADLRAAQGQREWFNRQPEGVVSRAEKMLEVLRIIKASEDIRLRETQVLIADLEARMKSVEEIGGLKAQSYANYLWFDYVKIKAENAYLSAHVRDIAAVTGD